MLVHNDLATPGNGTVTSAVNQLYFSDGSVTYLGQSLSQGSSLTFTWLGNSPYNSLNGSAYGSNVFEITTHNIAIGFGNAAAVGGSNTVKCALGSGQTDVYLAEREKSISALGLPRAMCTGRPMGPAI